jgi:membrane protease subunit (stomatin/prohibitin family)
VSTANVVNPGLVNVADQADGPTSVDQAVTVSPPLTAQRSVDGGEFSPERPDVLEVTQNNVAGQVYGTGTPADVFV